MVIIDRLTDEMELELSALTASATESDPLATTVNDFPDEISGNEQVDSTGARFRIEDIGILLILAECVIAAVPEIEKRLYKEVAPDAVKTFLNIEGGFPARVVDTAGLVVYVAMHDVVPAFGGIRDTIGFGRRVVRKLSGTGKSRPADDMD